ncbi:MAG: hypothetical protein FJW34_09760 [Acidobacteria bacterium]|nr:hypothetical protein [Acidobacteriota bacterium]
MAVTRWSADAPLRALLTLALLLPAFAGAAPLTAEQILEKSIAATGGRKAIEAVTSTVAKGEIDVLPQHAHALIEYYAKAPAKRLIVTHFEGVGEVLQGCDGVSAWTHDPGRGLRNLTGAEKEDALRECAFHAEIQWRDFYPKVELAGMEKVGEREAYKIVMTPASGKPATRYIDAENFLLIRQISTRESSEGAVSIDAELSDYRDVAGVKVPFLIRQKMQGYELVIKMILVENNAPIDDARFAKPAKK